MNQIQLIGRLARTPEMRYTTNNKPVANFTIAVNRVGQDEADFINCVVWNNQAENLCKYQEKGSLIGIVGTLRVDQYQDNNGDNRYKTYVLVHNVIYLGSKKSITENVAEPQQTSVEQNSTTENDPYKDFGEEIALNPDDLPF